MIKKIMFLAVCGFSLHAFAADQAEIVALYNAAQLSLESVNDLVGPVPLWKYKGAQQRGYKKGKGGLQKEKDAQESALAKWGERYVGLILLATEKNNVALVKKLLQHKANTDKRCKDQVEIWMRLQKPVMVAVKADNKPIVDAFLDAHVTMRYLFYADNLGPLACAALHGSVNALQTILDYKTAWASPGGTFSEFTSEYAKEVNAPDERGLTPLDYANLSVRNGTATQEKYEATKALLLAAGATGKSEADLDAWDAEFQAA